MTAGKGGELRGVDGSQQASGLVIYRASRLEGLLKPLTQLLAATRPANVLAPQTIIAAHPGMKQWLKGALAHEYGAGGIAANLDVLLPSAWIDRLAQQQLGQQAVSLPRYQRQILRWSIHEAFGADVEGVTDGRIAAYLRPDAGAAAGGASSQARRRFQLADRLARIYSQYLVYRPDWLRAWEQGHFHAASRAAADGVMASTEQQLLGPLWRHLQRRLGKHRGDVVAALIEQLNGADADPSSQALHVFGVSHLAPSELAVLRAFARHRLVALYVPDPCREYWGGLDNTQSMTALHLQRSQELIRIEGAQGNDYWVDQTHPLLASWGRMGQHFIMSLADGEGEVLADVRHHADEHLTAPTNRLQRLQHSIRALDPDTMKVDVADASAAQAEREDPSLRIHACHTRLRELEVLRDQLLDALASDSQGGDAIGPGDILVMAPDIQAYVPLIPSVFGVAGSAQGVLPYHLADVAVARSHGLFGAFQRLIDLPGTRVTTPEVIDLLAVPEVSRRLGLDAAGVDELAEWLRESRVAWALDASFRKGFGVPGIAEHTFAWAMDRMVAGYLMADASVGERQPAVVLPDSTEIAPITGIHGPAAAHIGALDHLLQEIQSLCGLAGQSRSAEFWSDELERRFDALFLVNPMDREAREAKAMILGFIRSIASEPKAAQLNPMLHFSVVRDLLVERLSAAPARQRFLMGGVTFCGMVPQRSIPFKVVAVLGLNDGEFPRSVSDGGLDLMSRYRRLGDRDVRTEDRYLFLETVMSARARLHLSYIGEGVKDGKPRNPAPPLAELIAALDAAAGLTVEDDKVKRPWIVKHPLQPFDARYFDGRDARLFSYREAFSRMHGAGDRVALEPFFHPRQVQGERDAMTAVAIGPAIALHELHAYYKDPAKQVLQRRMQVRLDALESDRLPEDEPLEAKFEAIQTVASKVFFKHALHATAEAPWPPDVPPDWLRLTGILPPGRAGKAAWDAECEKVNAMLEQFHQIPGLDAGNLVAVDGHLDLDIDGVRITGQVQQVFCADSDGGSQWELLRVFPGKDSPIKSESELTFKDRVPMFLDWALLRLQNNGSDAAPAAIRMSGLVKGNQHPWQDGINDWDEHFVTAKSKEREAMRANLAGRVGKLLHWWTKAQQLPAWYFPKTSWEALTSLAKAEAARAAKPDDEQSAAMNKLGIEDPAISVGSAWIATHKGGTGERDYAPGYSRLLAGDVDFSEGDELTALFTFAQQLHQCITFDAFAEEVA